MKYFLFAWILLAVSTGIKSQTANAENTFAVVVGIANYENERINLNYANRDAEIFAGYLMSKSGGAVPEDNIRLLTDTNATTAAVYNALKWVRKKTELAIIQDDKAKPLVYFYFSGHGDVETDTRDNMGFLLAFNSPPNNYIHNAIRIEDINSYARTLSIDLNANVVIITDACRSGKLAGSKNRGSSLVGKELSIVRNREVRIASCTPEQLSMEDERWGNGRGVFSWYLVNGLKGLADKDSDKSVTLQEIKQYMDSCISSDAVLKEMNHKQTPLLQGNDRFTLAAVHPEILVTMVAPAPVVNKEIHLPDLFWKQLGSNLDTSSVFGTLLSFDKESIPYKFVQQVAEHPFGVLPEKSKELVEQLKNNPEILKAFTEKMVEWLHTKGQTVINQYLQGDEAEMEKRRYYNGGNGYQSYADMLGLALKLVEKDDPLFRILSINQLYLSGVALRLKMPTANEAEKKKLVGKAMILQLNALAIDDNAPYVQNELGVLYKEKNLIDSAILYFNRAGMLAPSWSLPKANLCAIYANQKNWEAAKQNGEEAEQLQPSSHTTQTSLGVMYESMGNLLYAEEHYRQAIDINSRHYLPFERLGNLYYSATKYALADSFFYEADIRKRGFHFRNTNFFSQPPVVVESPQLFLPCRFDTSLLLKDDIMAFLYVGYHFYQRRRYDLAERFYKKIIAIDKSNPLVFHYLGKIFFDQRKWENAEVMFLLANDYSLGRETFQKYCDSLLQGRIFPYEHTCFEAFFRGKHYYQPEDHYFLASGYEQWRQYEKAENWYKKIIRDNPSFIGTYVKLCSMLEKQERFEDGEKLLQSYAPYDKQTSIRELNGYYRRIVSRFPESGNWYYRLGLLLYDKAQGPPYVHLLDTILYIPRQEKEIFIGLGERRKLGEQLLLDANDANPDMINMEPLKDEYLSVMLPGIEETVLLAEPIYTPRRDAITYFTLADSFSIEEPVKADIQFKMGNVFVWGGSPKQAFPHYIKATELDAGNASIRLNLVDVCKTIYKNREGLRQLNRLYDSAQINFPKRLLYSEWLIHAAEFSKAGNVITEALQIYPYTVPEAYDLWGRLYLLSKQPAKAIGFYKQYAAIFAKNADAPYSIARLYAASNNKREAWKWLRTAVRNGFIYGYILNNDPTWTAYRNSAEWKTLLMQIKMKEYRIPLQ